MKMSYTVLGTNNMDVAIKFYDSLFEGMGAPQTFKTDRMNFWQFENFVFAIAVPFDKDPATNGNGTMIGFDVESEDEVKRLYAKCHRAWRNLRGGAL